MSESEMFEDDNMAVAGAERDLWRGRQWRITENVLEDYDFEPLLAPRFWVAMTPAALADPDLVRHVTAKTWVDRASFLAGLREACRLTGITRPDC